jgi:branched-chain amino acid transport system permease protein
VLTTIEELSRATFGGTGRGTDTVVYAGLIVLIAVFYPSGIIGWCRDRLRRRKTQAERKEAVQSHATQEAAL